MLGTKVTTESTAKLRRRLQGISGRSWHGAIFVAAGLAVGLGGCSAAEKRAIEDAEETMLEQLDPDGTRDLEVQIDPDTTVIRVDDAESGDVFIDGDGQPRPEFLDPTIPLPEDLVITWASIQQGITEVEGEVADPVEGLGPLRELYENAAASGAWEVETDPQPIGDEDVVMLAYLPDGSPLDIRLDATTFTLLIGRYWEPVDPASPSGGDIDPG